VRSKSYVLSVLEIFGGVELKMNLDSGAGETLIVKATSVSIT